MGKRNKARKQQETVEQVVTDQNVEVVAEGEELLAADTGAEIVVEADASVEMSNEGEELVVAATQELDEVVAGLETEEAKREAYVSQSADAPADGEAAPLPADALSPDSAEPIPAAAAATKPVRTPRATLLTNKASDLITRQLGENPQRFFQLDHADSTDDTELEGIMSRTLDAIDKLDKKAREKAVNFIGAIVNNRAPSVYTRQAIQKLHEKGTLALKDLVNIYQTDFNYKPGTARRQASQMFALLPIMGIAKRAASRGAPIEFNPNSTLFGRVVFSTSGK